MSEEKIQGNTTGTKEALTPCLVLFPDEQGFTAGDAAVLAERLSFGDLLSKESIFLHKPGENGALGERIKKGKYTAVLGCGPLSDLVEHHLKNLGTRCGIGETYRRALQIPAKSAEEYPFQPAVSRIGKELARFSMMERYRSKTVPLNQHVLVCGAGIAGIEAAGSLSNFGYPVTLVEQSNAIGGELLKTTASDLTSWKTNSPKMDNVDIFTETELSDIAGTVGNYRVSLSIPSGEKTIECGAIVLTQGRGNPVWAPFEGLEPNFLLLPGLKEKVLGLPRKREIYTIGILLDYQRHETKASSDMAFSLAMEMQKREDVQVYIFLREVRVAAPGMEKYYDEVREAGVVFVKYDSLSCFLNDDGFALLQVFEPILQRDLEIQCSLIGVSPYGLETTPDKELLERTGVSPDREGALQENNLRMNGVETNRPGIFVAGAVKGTYYVPEVIREAKNAGMAVHQLLRKKEIEVELSHAVVDKDKCAICLTCIRSCPYKAMVIDREEGVAACLPEVCQRCGICAGECPAKAITLPAYSDEIVMNYLD
jgi:heterodisulfide reductase subunit A2